MKAENPYIKIYNSNGNELLSVLVTKDAKRTESIMTEDFIELSWVSNQKTIIPVGAYILDANGDKFSLYDPYEPEQIDEGEFRYNPQFQSNIIGGWSKTPLFFYVYGNDGRTIQSKEPEWNITDNAKNILDLIAKAIETETGEKWKTAVAIDLGGYKTFSFNNTDVLSALNTLAEEWETEWYTDKNTKTLYLGKCQFGDAKATVLKVGDNIKAPGVTNNKEGYFNRFYVFGSTRNITQEYQGANVNNLVSKRLTLDPSKYPNGYIDKRLSTSEPILSKTLIFDEIYPKSSLVIAEARPRLMYVLSQDDNADEKRVQIGTDSNGKPIYDTYTIWYIQLKDSTTGRLYRLANTDTYSKENPEGVKIAGKNISIHFSSGALLGREFELQYHTKTETVTNSDGTPFQVREGDFEILYTKEGDYIIPSQTGLIPSDNDTVILFNLRMPEEYIGNAYKELEEEANKKIAEYLEDRNNYEFASNPVAFAKSEDLLNLKIGQSVTFINGNYSYETRILSIERSLDLPCYQTITVGNEKIKGKRETLEENVADANKDINLIAAFNQLAQSASDSYNRAIQQMTEGFARISNMWKFDPENENTIYSDFNVYSNGFVSAKGISLGGNGDGTGEDGGGNIPGITIENLSDLLDVEIQELQNGQTLIWDGEKWVNKFLSSGGGSGDINYEELAEFLDEIGYATKSWVNLQGFLKSVTWNNIEGKPSWIGTEKPKYAFSELTTHPTTLAGYGITDAKIENGTIILGNNSITPITSQDIFVLNLNAGKFSADIYNPLSSTKTVYIPTHTSHLTNDSDFITAAAVESLYVKKAGDTMTGTLSFNDIFNPIVFGRGSYNYVSTSQAGGQIAFVADGKAVTLANSSFVISGSSVHPGATNNYSLGTSGNRWSNVYSVLGNFSGLIIASGGVTIPTGQKLTIGPVSIEYDADNLGLKISGGGVYSESYVSAKGIDKNAGTSSGKSYLYELLDVSASVQNASNGKVLMKSGNEWIAGDAGLNKTELEMYLTSNGYLKGGDIPSSDLYVKKTGDTVTGALTFTNRAANIIFGGTSYNYVYANQEDAKIAFIAGTGTAAMASSSLIISSEGVYPGASATYFLGTSVYRWNILYSVSGNFSGQITSRVSTGTSPFVISSTTLNENLNADLLDGRHATDFLGKDETAQLAEKANQLVKTCNLWGQPFNGTADVTGSLTNVADITMSGKILITNQNSDSSIQFMRAGINYIYAGAEGGAFAFITNGKSYAAASADLRITDVGIYPGTTNTHTLGLSSIRWSNVYSVLGNFSGLITANGGLTVPATQKITIGSATIEWDEGNKGLKISGGGLYSESYISAKGIDGNAGTTGGETLTFVTSGSGNAITRILKNGTTVTAYKDFSFATEAWVEQRLGNLTLDDYLPLKGGKMTGSISFDDVFNPLVFGRASYNYIGTSQEGASIAFVANGKTATLANATTVIAGNSLYPGASNTYLLGLTSNRWSNIYSVLGNFSGQITSTVTTGTSPFAINSTTVNTNLNADMLDGIHISGIPHYDAWISSPGWNADEKGNHIRFTYSASGAPATGTVLSVQANNFGFQLLTRYSADGPLYYRRFGSDTDGGMGSWQQLARITDNVASATYATTAGSANQLTTSHNIWGQPFNGTSDVIGSLTNVTDITMSGTLFITNTSSTSSIQFSRAGANYFYSNAAGGYFSFISNGKAYSAASADLTIANNVVYPGTNAVTSLGRTSNRWSNLYTVSGNFSGAVTMSLTLDVAGLITAQSGIKIGDATISWDGTALKVDKGFYSDSFISSKGIDNNAGTSVGETLTFVTSGSGNAITRIVKSGTTVTAYKDFTFLTDADNPSGGGTTQTLYSLSFLGGKFSTKTYTPNASAQTVNIPVATSHLLNDSGFITSSDLSGYVTTDTEQTITGFKIFNSNIEIVRLVSTSTAPQLSFYETTTQVANIGYRLNMAFIANIVNGGRIGVTDAGSPQFWSNASGTNKYTLLHSGNWSNYISVGGTGGDYLPLSGGTLTGTLNASTQISLGGAGVNYINARTSGGSIAFVANGKATSSNGMNATLIIESAYLRAGQNNVFDIGSSSYRWKTIYGVSGNFSSAVSQNTSDLRLKTDLGSIDCLEVLLKLGNVFTYRYNLLAVGNRNWLDSTTLHTGIAYQNAIKANIPDFTGTDEYGYGYVNYLSSDYQATLLGGVLALALKQRAMENDMNGLKNEVIELRKENQDLKQRVAELERA